MFPFLFVAKAQIDFHCAYGELGKAMTSPLMLIKYMQCMTDFAHYLWYFGIDNMILYFDI